MAYDTFTPSTATDKALQVLRAVKTFVEANGWTTVDNEYSDGTYTRFVFKSPSNDFHAVFWTVNAGLNGTTAGVSGNGICVTVCEGYNATNHTLIRPAVWTATSVACSATDDSVGSTEYTLAQTISNFHSGNTIYYVGMSTNNTPAQTPVYMSVFSDMIWISGNYSGGSSNYAWVGKFTSKVTNSGTNDAYTYAAGVQGGTGNGVTAVNVAVTRSAMNAGKAAHDWRLGCISYVVASGGSIMSSPSDGTNFDLYQGGGVFFGPVALVRQSTRSTNGYLRGFGSRMLAGYGAGSYGDTCVVDGTTYFMPTSASNIVSIWLQKG